MILPYVYNIWINYNLSKVQRDAKNEPPYFTTTPQKITNKMI
jgi:hypothetical protein